MMVSDDVAVCVMVCDGVRGWETSAVRAVSLSHHLWAWCRLSSVRKVLLSLTDPYPIEPCDDHQCAVCVREHEVTW